MSLIKKSILDVELNSNFTHRNNTLMFLFPKVFIPSSVFLFCLNKFNIKGSIILVKILTTTHSSCHHLKLSFNARLRVFFFLNKRSYLNLARLISNEAQLICTRVHNDLLRLGKTIPRWLVFCFHTVELNRRTIYLARLIQIDSVERAIDMNLYVCIKREYISVLFFKCRVRA